MEINEERLFLLGKFREEVAAGFGRDLAAEIREAFFPVEICSAF
jgi:hypothetical protein